MPVIVHVVFFVLKTVEVPQLQYLDKVVANFFVQFIKVADVPVIIQRQAPAVVRVRDGSPDSVHRQSGGLFQCAPATFTHSANCTEDQRDPTGVVLGHG